MTASVLGGIIHRAPSALIVACCVCFLLTCAASASSLQFLDNGSNDYDYGRQITIPEGFGDGEFTMELWIKPYEDYPIGTTVGFGRNDRLNWTEEDNEPYSASNWWYEGNFLLDGHNNDGFEDGTFSLQFYGGGRLRWLIGDGKHAGPGGHWSVGAYPASGTPSLLDGRWHHVTLVRRWTGFMSASFELWVDGVLIDKEESRSRVNLAEKYWDQGVDGGWYWGAEKQAAENSLSTYEDFKGLIDEIRYWSIAKSEEEIRQNYNAPLTGDEPGLVGVYSMEEGRGKSTCNDLTGSQCIRLNRMKPGHWTSENAPLAQTDAIAPSPPTNLNARVVRD